MSENVLGRRKTDHLPLILVIILVLVFIVPAVRTVIQTRGGASSVVTIEADSDYYLTWEEYTAAHGIENWNWNDAADAIEKIAYHAADLYDEGDTDSAYEFAKATYWGYYETTGFERNTMTYISGSRVSACELQFTTFRKAVKKDLGRETVRQEAETLSRMLHEDALTLSPDGPIANISAGTATASQSQTQTEASSGGGAATFAGSFGIILREGLEAILVVGAIITYLKKSGNEKGIRPVYIGAILGIICSFIMAAVLSWLKAINPETTMSQEIIEGFAALIAVVVLFYVSNWMVSKSEAAAWTSYIEGKVASSTQRGNMMALGFTAWLAVFREGAEVILFYQPMLGEGHANMVWAGFVVGCIALVIVYLIMRLLSVKLPLKPFFMAMSILMAIMTICFLGSGIKELMEGGVFDDFAFMLSSPGWLSWIPYNDVLDVFGIYPLVGTIVPQIILLVITIATFFVQLNKNKEIKELVEKRESEERIKEIESGNIEGSSSPPAENAEEG